MQYYDAQVDDARHTMELARTAASYGATSRTGLRAVGFLRQGERVTGVRAVDKLTDREFEINAKQIVNATGVWTDDTEAMVGERGQSTCGPPRASTSSCPAAGSTPRPA